MASLTIFSAWAHLRRVDYSIDMYRNYKITVLHVSTDGVIVSIDAFQALDSGSIPGRRNQYLLPLFTLK